MRYSYSNEPMAPMLDIVQPDTPVEIEVDRTRGTIYVHVENGTVLRIGRCHTIRIVDSDTLKVMNGSRNRYAERNIAIVDQYDNQQMTFDELAKQYGITKSRVAQIYHKIKDQRGRTFTQEPL